MIIVTGMHRSGTSAVSQLLRAWGVDFGPESSLLAADRWNERGYLESKRVLDVNSRIVTGWPRSGGGPAAWAGQLVYLGRPGEAAIARRARRHRRSILELTEEYSGRAVKDPRFCLTLRHWRAAREPDHVVLCLRGPGAVAASLARRQRVPRGLALRFWHYHWSTLLEQLDGLNPHWIRFEDLFTENRDEALAQLAARLGLGPGPETGLGVAGRTLSGNLVHARDDDAHLPPAVERLWRYLAARAS